MLRRTERETLYMFILFLVLLPQPTVALNCQMACDQCYDDNEDPPLREVYCSMCEECLSANKDTKLKTVKKEKPVNIEKQPTLRNPNNLEKQPAMRAQEYGWDPQEQAQGTYPECPTAPPCPEEEEEEAALEEMASREVVSEPTCANPYMPPCLPVCPPPTRPTTCPPIPPCKTKKLKAPKKTPRPKPTRPNPPMMPWCWPFPFPPQATTAQDQEKMKDTTIKDFLYVYVGVPKGVIANDTS